MIFCPASAARFFEKSSATLFSRLLTFFVGAHPVAHTFPLVYTMADHRARIYGTEEDKVNCPVRVTLACSRRWRLIGSMRDFFPVSSLHVAVLHQDRRMPPPRPLWSSTRAPIVFMHHFNPPYVAVARTG